MIELIFVALIFYIIKALWNYSTWNYRHLNNFVSKINGPPAYPIIGSMLYFFDLSQPIMNKMIQLQNDYGPDPYKLWFGPILSVHISKPKDVQIVLNSSKALEKGLFYTFFKKSFGNGLPAASPIDKWKKHRRIITPAFNSAALTHFFHVFNEKNQILVRNLMKEVDKPSSFDLWDYISSTFIDIICQTALDYDTTSDSNTKYDFEEAVIKTHELSFARIFKIWLYPNFVYSIYEKLFGIDKIYKSLNKLPLKIIKEKKFKIAQKKEETKVIDPNDEKNKLTKTVLDILLDYHETDTNYSINDLRDEVVTMIITGSEPSATTSCFCLLMLALNPDIQDKVYDEMCGVLKNKVGPISFDDVAKLVYLEQVLMETLRLYPVVPIVLRQLEDEVKIDSGEHVLPKGTLVCIHIDGTHRIPELYPNPLTFDPENFSKDNIAKRHKYSFIPFSSGPRGCIGNKYAMLSMKHLVTTFLRKFSIHTDIKFSDIQFKVDIIIRSVNGFPVTIRKRKSNDVQLESDV